MALKAIALNYSLKALGGEESSTDKMIVILVSEPLIKERPYLGVESRLDL